MKTNRIALAALLCCLGTTTLQADDSVGTKIADIYGSKDALSGKQVNVQGHVVKVNNNIMRRNFVHIQDGTGNADVGTNDLIVTTTDTVAVGDQVNVSGTVVLDQDFGFGYRYPVLVEQASVTAAP